MCTGQAEELRANIEAHAWDGGWYRRAYFDDGTPLGSSTNDECRIDSISQSWAVISGAGDPLRARQAMAAVDRLLVERDAGLIKLLDPPFDTSSLEPGYIKGYVPGVRENGGQYTHAAIWAAMAFAMMGDVEHAWELFSMLNPIHHGSQPADIELYKVEPYVMSADIYAAPPHYRPGRLDLVHRRRRLDVPAGRGDAAGPPFGGGQAAAGATDPGGLGVVQDPLPVPRDLLPHHRPADGRGTGASGSEAPRADAERVRRVRMDGADLDQTGPLQGTIPLVDDRRDHYVEVELG